MNDQNSKSPVICENCRESVATRHLRVWQAKSAETSEDSVKEHHFCEACAEVSHNTNPLFNPCLEAHPNARMLQLRVINVSDRLVNVTHVNHDATFESSNFTLLKDRIPSHYAVEGMEFGILVTSTQLSWLQGK